MRKTAPGLERSYEKITKPDLRKLGIIAAHDRTILFDRYPRWRRLYGNRLLCVALCQGAAQHKLDGKTGVKDFDIWSFYRQHKESPFPYRRIATADFGPSKFGRYPKDPLQFTGRRVDLMGRSIDVKPDTGPIAALVNYLSSAITTSARMLSKKAVVLIEPADFLGQIIWPTQD